MKKLILITVLFVSMSFSTSAQDAMLGEVKLFAGNFAPRGWAFCEGQILPISQYNALFAILGTTYGGDGRTTFALPDLRGRTPIGPGTGPGLSTVKWGTSRNGVGVKMDETLDFPKTQPTLGMHYIIALQGIFPSRS